MSIRMKDLIDDSILPFMNDYFYKIYEAKEQLIIDEVWAYNDKAQFVAGKVINACSYVVSNEIKSKDDVLLDKLRKIIDFTSKMPMETWGMMNALYGIYRLKINGIIEQAVSEEALNRLKKSIDWRYFVDVNDNLKLINLPTNYYGVAFGVARYRELLGWENEGYSKLLLNKLIEHIDTFSGEYGFMDDTLGGGRFDRYSILIPGEIGLLITNTELDMPIKLKNMLRKSSEIFLSLSNNKGNGFSYGRSIGAYGDTAAAEVLSIAARLDVLNNEEKELAYGYNCMTIKKYNEFWIDKDMNSLNMWNKGRKTDEYRNKNRILGETLSTCMQIINSYENWCLCGFENKCVVSDFCERLDMLPSYSFYKFAGGEYDRAMAVIRNKNHVFSIPFVSGAAGLYNNTPYLPIPNESFMLETSANTVHPNLVPMIILDKEIKLMPIVYMKNVKEKVEGNKCIITYNQDELCMINDNEPSSYTGIKSETRYTFEPGVMIREDKIFIEHEVEVKNINIEFATYSEEPKICENKVIFNKGDIYEIEMDGFDKCSLEKLDNNEQYKTPHGVLKYKITWIKNEIYKEKILNFKWVMRYKAHSNK